jgi:hypothetical protein
MKKKHTMASPVTNKNEDKQDTESDINFPEIESWSEIF